MILFIKSASSCDCIFASPEGLWTLPAACQAIALASATGQLRPLVMSLNKIRYY